MNKNPAHIHTMDRISRSAFIDVNTMLDEGVKLLSNALPNLRRIDIVNGSTNNVPRGDLAYEQVVSITTHVFNAIQVELFAVKSQYHLVALRIEAGLKDQVCYRMPEAVCKCV